MRGHLHGTVHLVWLLTSQNTCKVILWGAFLWTGRTRQVHWVGRNSILRDSESFIIIFPFNYRPRRPRWETQWPPSVSGPWVRVEGAPIRGDSVTAFPWVKLVEIQIRRLTAAAGVVGPQPIGPWPRALRLLPLSIPWMDFSEWLLLIVFVRKRAWWIKPCINEDYRNGLLWISNECTSQVPYIVLNGLIN